MSAPVRNTWPSPEEAALIEIKSRLSEKEAAFRMGISLAHFRRFVAPYVIPIEHGRRKVYRWGDLEKIERKRKIVVPPTDFESARETPKATVGIETLRARYRLG